MYKILLVDDEAEIRNGYARFFPWEQQQFEVVCCAANGEKALELLKNTYIDVVICDLVMPVMDGITFIEQVNRLYPRTLVIVLSGHSNFEYARSLIKLKILQYVLKSDKHEVLIEALGQARNELDQRISICEDDYTSVALKLIDKNLTNVTLGSVAELMQLCPSYLSRIFKAKTGINFHSYVLQQKLQYACKMLSSSTIKIYEIAWKLGYSDVKNFNRMFKQQMQTTPNEYRRKSERGKVVEK